MYFPRKILKPEVDVHTYYYYCRRCCCPWWHLLLGLLVLQPSISSLLQSATSVITKCDSSFYYKVRQLFITKCDKCYYKVHSYYKVWQFYYKVRRLLQSATVQCITKWPLRRQTKKCCCQCGHSRQLSINSKRDLSN